MICDVTLDVHGTQVNMNVNIPTHPQPSDVTLDVHVKYVCFEKRPKRWRGFPPAGRH